MLAMLNTKDKILDTAIVLFAERGVGNCTIRDIADEVGIKAPSIYYFYKSKEALLEEIFDEFEYRFPQNRMTVKKILELARKSSVVETLSALFYTFGTGEDPDPVKTVKICKIVFSQQFENQRASQLWKEIYIEGSKQHIMDALNGLQMMGKIRRIDNDWAAYIIMAFLSQVFNEAMLYNQSARESEKRHNAVISLLVSAFANNVAP